jgi:hypothetical protein
VRGGKLPFPAFPRALEDGAEDQVIPLSGERFIMDIHPRSDSGGNPVREGLAGEFSQEMV